MLASSYLTFTSSPPLHEASVCSCHWRNNVVFRTWQYHEPFCNFTSRHKTTFMSTKGLIVDRFWFGFLPPLHRTNSKPFQVTGQKHIQPLWSHGLSEQKVCSSSQAKRQMLTKCATNGYIVWITADQTDAVRGLLCCERRKSKGTNSKMKTRAFDNQTKMRRNDSE